MNQPTSTYTKKKPQFFLIEDIVPTIKTEIEFDEEIIQPNYSVYKNEPDPIKYEDDYMAETEMCTDSDSSEEEELEPGETNYEIIEINTQRSYLFSKLTKMLYTRNGRKSNKSGEEVQYFKCFEKSCKATGSLAEGRNFLENPKNIHLHDDGAFIARQKIAINSLRSEVVQSLESGSRKRSVEKFRQIEEGLLNYKKIRSQISKLRRKTIGNIINKDQV